MSTKVQWRWTTNGSTSEWDAPTWAAACIWLMSIGVTVVPWVLGWVFVAKAVFA